MHYIIVLVFFFNHKTAYEVRISDWSSDVCSSDLWIGLGGTHSAVCATEVSTEEYLAYTTEETEKMEVMQLASELDGNVELAIKRIAIERRDKARSDERRVGKECGSRCRTQWAP